MMEQILMTLMAAGAVLGGIDRILGNKFGLGEPFEKGFLLLGPMALSMAGMICLAPVLAEALRRAVVTAGLALAAVEHLTGWNPIRGMAPIGEAMAVVSSIGVVMLGSLPVAELLRRALARPLTRAGGRLGMKPQSLTGMLISLATPLPVLSMYPDMDDRGKAAVGAFLVSGTSLLAAHMGFALSTDPEMLAPLAAAKLSGAFAAAALALWAERTGTKPEIRR